MRVLCLWTLPTHLKNRKWSVTFWSWGLPLFDPPDMHLLWIVEHLLPFEEATQFPRSISIGPVVCQRVHFAGWIWRLRMMNIFAKNTFRFEQGFIYCQPCWKNQPTNQPSKQASKQPTNLQYLQYLHFLHFLSIYLSSYLASCLSIYLSSYLSSNLAIYLAI